MIWLAALFGAAVCGLLARGIAYRNVRHDGDADRIGWFVFALLATTILICYGLRG
jgi:hypothetical protein